MKTAIQIHLTSLRQVLEQHALWEAVPPSTSALASQEPFCLDTLSATQWLQWIFIPRMHALLEANADLPRNFAITPYLEEALKDQPCLAPLHQVLSGLEQQLKQ